MRASPVGQGPAFAHALARSGPAARWMAPQTPPPGASCSFAAFTIASTASVVMSTIHAESCKAGSGYRNRVHGVVDLDDHIGLNGSALQHAGEPASPSLQSSNEPGPSIQADVRERVEHRAGLAWLAYLEHHLPYAKAHAG